MCAFFLTGQEDVQLIYHAFDIYHDLTCITFVPWSGFEPNYISIENSQTGCWASVGRTGGKQVVNLQSPGCLTKVNI
jgi:ADP-ribosylation factor-like protein 3